MNENWSIKFTPEGESDLRSLGKPIQKRVISKLSWLEENFPKIIPEPLSNKWKGYFKLRVGEWRVVYQIEFETMLLTIHRIEHRSKVYKERG